MCALTTHDYQLLTSQRLEKEPLGWDLTESRIDANRLLRILEGLGQRNELGVRERAVVVPTRVARVALDTLRITFHCAGKVALLE
jgi:hypothetical protein